MCLLFVVYYFQRSLLRFRSLHLLIAQYRTNVVNIVVVVVWGTQQKRGERYEMRSLHVCEANNAKVLDTIYRSSWREREVYAKMSGLSILVQFSRSSREHRSFASLPVPLPHDFV
jgi:hypothetical protein